MKQRQDKYEALVELLKNEETAKTVWGNSPEEAQANPKAKGLDFTVEELLALAQPPEGEMDEGELDNVSGGVWSGECIWPPILRSPLGKFPFPFPGKWGKMLS